jgi:hypothetical protein
MRCAICKRQIRRGVEEAKRIEYRQQPDGSVKIFGYQMKDGSLAEAHGPLVKVIHSVHYWTELKAARRGGPRAGGAISAWEQDSIEEAHEDFRGAE